MCLTNSSCTIGRVVLHILSSTNMPSRPRISVENSVFSIQTAISIEHCCSVDLKHPTHQPPLFLQCPLTPFVPLAPFTLPSPLIISAPFSATAYTKLTIFP
jgi:hypothetical protein